MQKIPFLGNIKILATSGRGGLDRAGNRNQEKDSAIFGQDSFRLSEPFLTRVAVDVELKGESSKIFAKRSRMGSLTGGQHKRRVGSMPWKKIDAQQKRPFPRGVSLLEKRASETKTWQQGPLRRDKTTKSRK